MSLVWIVLALGVSVLTIAVVSQLLEAGVSRAAGRLIASAVGVLMLIEGALVLFVFPRLSDDFGMTALAHGVAMIAAGAGIWGIAHRRWLGDVRKSFKTLGDF